MLCVSDGWSSGEGAISLPVEKRGTGQSEVSPGNKLGLNQWPGYRLVHVGIYLPSPPGQGVSTTVNPRPGALLIMLRAKLASERVG